MNEICRDHQNTPRLRGEPCETCSRLKVEAKITRKLTAAFLKAGAELAWYYGEDEAPTYTRNRAELDAEAMAADEAWLRVRFKDGRRGSVFLVYGNSGWDLITDYHMPLEPELRPVMAYAETFEN